MIYLKVLCFILFSNLLISQSGIDSTELKSLDSLLNVSKNLRSKGELNQSLEITLKVEKLALEKYGRISEIYANCCINHGKWCIAKSQHQEAESWYFEAIDIFKKLYGEEHNQYGKALNNLGVLYYLMGKFDKCEPIYLKVQQIQRKAVGINHVDYGVALNNLALLYKEIGRIDKAEPYFLESYQVFKNVLGVKHPQYASSITNLAVFYFNLGNLQKAESYYLEAKEVREKVLGKMHPDYGESLNNLASLYMDLGNYSKSEAYYLESNQIFEKIVGKNHPQYAQSLYNLAYLYNKMKRSKEALALLLEAKMIISKELNLNHPDYITCISLLANSYKLLKQFDLAEELFLEAKVKQQALTGINSLGYTRNILGLAKFYIDTDRDTLALELLNQAYDILTQFFGQEQSEYSLCVNYLAIAYEKLQNFKLATNFFEERLKLNQIKLHQSIQYLSVHELNKYSELFSEFNSTLFSVNYRRYQNLGSLKNLSSASLNSILFHKGFVLMAANRLNAMSGQSPETKEMYATIQSNRRRLNKEYLKKLKERNNNLIAELEENSNSLEKNLALKIAGYDDVSKQLSWVDLKKKLRKEEALIEFVSFNLDFPVKTDSIMYVALILRPQDSVPIYIPLFEEKELTTAISQSQGVSPSELYANRGVKPINRQNYSNIYNIIWKPLEPYLENYTKIYLAASGILHRLNLNAVEISNGVILSDKYNLVQLGSTRQINTRVEDKKTIKDALLIGGIDYNFINAVQEPKLEFSSTAVNNSYSSQNNHLVHAWNYLPGTESEVIEIQHLFKNNKLPVTILQSSNATEQAIKQVGVNKASPSILHISTHGYFFSDNQSGLADSTELRSYVSTFKYSKEPMLRSGLILAGANHSWMTDSYSSELEDGILTAFEISQMDLSNTELVVLSACETGLGDIQGNEGVFGLQRAFKIAGANYIIMSLWQVPDKQTSMLMSTFYKKMLTDKMNIPDAFHAAQKDMRDLGLDPYQWAGFVLIE